MGTVFACELVRINTSHVPSTSHNPNSFQGLNVSHGPSTWHNPTLCSLLSVPLKGLWWWKGLEGLTQLSALCRWKTKQRKRWSAGQLGFGDVPRGSEPFHLPHGPPTLLSSHPHPFFSFLHSQKERQMLFNGQWESQEKSPFLLLCTSMDQSSAPPRPSLSMHNTSLCSIPSALSSPFFLWRKTLTTNDPTRSVMITARATVQ